MPPHRGVEFNQAIAGALLSSLQLDVVFLEVNFSAFQQHQKQLSISILQLSLFIICKRKN